MVQVAVGGGVNRWFYQYEASRPGATAASPGTKTTRACSTSGVLPWADVTQAQAQAACAAVKDSTGVAMHLCAASEWQTACEGPGGPQTNAWSISTAPTTYTAQICNDVTEAASPAVWATGSNGAQTGATGKVCYTDWAAAGQLHDMSGNVSEWTSTPVTAQIFNGTECNVTSSGTAGIMTVTLILQTSESGFISGGAQVGDSITLANAATAGTNGTWQISAITDDTHANVIKAGWAATGATDANNNKAPPNGIKWTVVRTYFQLRGGNYSQPSGGTTCEFNFDVASASFANADVGFRCCADNAP
jgi:formylglycine-generating enzyme required for sulfatase activity